MKAQFNSQYYAEAGAFVTKEESRYALHSVRVEPHPVKGVVIVATEGHTMCVFHDEGGSCEGDGITLRFEEFFANLCARKLTLAVNDDDSVSLHNGTKKSAKVTWADMVETKAFPSWRAVLPKWNPEIQRDDLNPEYLVRCSGMQDGPYSHVAIWHGSDGTQVTHGGDRPAVVCVQGRDDFFALVMPMRQTNETKYPELIEALRPKGLGDAEPSEVASNESA